MGAAYPSGKILMSLEVHRVQGRRSAPPHIEPKTMVLRAAGDRLQPREVEGDVLTCLRLDIQRA